MERFTVDLPEDVAESMRASVQAGRYANEGDILREAAREWIYSHGQNDDATIDPDTGYDLGTLRRLIREGDESGPGIPAEQVYAELRQQIEDIRAGRE